jgi:hypothetical protein
MMLLLDAAPCLWQTARPRKAGQVRLNSMLAQQEDVFADEFVEQLPGAQDGKRAIESAGVEFLVVVHVVLLV